MTNEERKETPSQAADEAQSVQSSDTQRVIATTPSQQEKDSQRAIAELFHEMYYRTQVWRETYWLGISALKCPLDLWIYQEILNEVRPDLIIETGTAHGGSALFLATLCDLLHGGQVLTIDIEERPKRPEHPRIQYIHGSSVATDVLAQVESQVQDSHRVLAILDSDHSEEHVFSEMKAYAPLVSVGSYLIVEDTNISGHPIEVENGAKTGPMEAVTAFLAEHKDFAIDRSREKFMLTFNPSGYLRKIA